MAQYRNRSPGRDRTADSLARGLGWFSIGLGLAEVIAPEALARALGMKGHETLIRTYGLREIATGIGTLASEDPTPWIWGRVGGDGLDLATLATALTGDNRKRDNVGIAIAAVAGVTVLDVICAQMLSAAEEPQPPRPMRDYSRRSGLPRPPDQMRGAARDFDLPPDMREPPAMRPPQAAAQQAPM
jgi:hypothetical protein